METGVLLQRREAERGRERRGEAGGQGKAGSQTGAVG